MAALSNTDPVSFSNPDEVIVTNIDLNLDIDFTSHVLSGFVNLTLSRLKPEIEYVILDTRDITIVSVCDHATGVPLTFQLGEAVHVFGSKLQIQLPNTATESCVVSIQYKTSPNCSALQWLKPEQTTGKRLPFLFSQCQAIHCRSLIPCQDTPYVKCPYTAKIRAPHNIKVLMSARLLGSIPCPSDGSLTEYSFRQDVCMPSYLIAIVGGDIVSSWIGPRSQVWSEPELIERCAYEFAQTEEMLKTAEALLGPYVWGHYDLLVLPPSFPYGGMENPCLTFVTPTLLAGDRSLADVVAHEISHSWTGNLVTNKTFEDFWLNEGNTEFVERKIVSRLKGGEIFRNLLSWSGWNGLCEIVNDLGEENPYTRLVINLRGVDPDDSFSAIPYEKGHAFLFYLEQLVGGPAVFDPFMRAYIDKFKYQSISTREWKEFLLSYFHEQAQSGVFDRVDWDRWLYGLGLPPVKPNYDMTMADGCLALADRWQKASDEQLEQFTRADIQNFLPDQCMAFLDAFLTREPSHQKVAKMGEVYNFTHVQNSEIKYRWIRVCIRARYEPIIPAALQFVSEQGRMKFVKPIYRDLYEWDASRERAIANFQAHRREMHQLTVSTVAKVLKLE